MRQRELSWSDFLKAGAIVGIPMLMVLAQPDLGTALTYVPIAVMGVFLGGLQWKQGVAVGLLAVVAIGGGFLCSAGSCSQDVSEAASDQFSGPRTRSSGVGVPS